MRISIRDQQAILPALAGFFLTALALFLYGMVLPEDWEQRFGIFACPIRLAAQLPIIESFATAASLPKEIIAGFLELVPWLSPILGFYLFLCLYDRQTYALALAQRDFLQEPDLLNTLRGLGTVCIVLFCFLMLLVLIPLSQPSPEEWRTFDEEWGFVFASMLDSRFWLAFWGATLVLGFSSLCFTLFWMFLTQGWVQCTGKVPPPLYAPDKVEWTAGTWADFSRKTGEAPPAKIKKQEAPTPQRRLTLIHDINFHNLPQRNRERLGWGIVACVSALVTLFVATALPFPEKVFVQLAFLFAYLPPLFALYLFCWGSLVRLKNGTLCLAVHWPPPDRARYLDQEPGPVSHLGGILGSLLLWAVCLFLVLIPLWFLPLWHLGCIFLALRYGMPFFVTADPMSVGLIAACVCTLVFFFGLCLFYGLLVCPVKLWAFATGKEPTLEQKKRIQQEGGIWTVDANRGLCRLA